MSFDLFFGQILPRFKTIGKSAIINLKNDPNVREMSTKGRQRTARVCNTLVNRIGCTIG